MTEAWATWMLVRLASTTWRTRLATTAPTQRMTRATARRGRNRSTWAGMSDSRGGGRPPWPQGQGRPRRPARGPRAPPDRSGTPPWNPSLDQPAVGEQSPAEAGEQTTEQLDHLAGEDRPLDPPHHDR